MFGLRAEALVDDLSPAEQQMVEIAKALSFNSRVLVMDEPTSALNNTEVAHLFSVIEDLKANGVDEIKELAERSGVSTKEIAELIKAIQSESRQHRYILI